MSLSMWEAAARIFEPPASPEVHTTGDMAKALDSKTVQTRHLPVAGCWSRAARMPLTGANRT